MNEHINELENSPDWEQAPEKCAVLAFEAAVWTYKGNTEAPCQPTIYVLDSSTVQRFKGLDFEGEVSFLVSPHDGRGLKDFLDVKEAMSWATLPKIER